MTAKEITAKKAELRAKAEEMVQVYNAAIQSGKFEDAQKAEEEMEKAINEYTSIARAECFEHLEKAENPMIEAITILTFDVIGKKDSKKGEEKIPVREIIDRKKAINLKELHKRVSGGIGADKKWYNFVEQMNFLLTAQCAVDLGLDPKEVHKSYKMSEISKAIDMGKTPTSNTNLLKTLQMVITAMIGEEYKATSHDVKYLLKIYTRKNRAALSVTCANHKYFTGYMAEICNHIVTGNPYGMDYEKEKQK